MHKQAIQKASKVFLGLFMALILLLPATTVQAQSKEDVQINQLKFARLIRLIDGYYVDSTNVNELTEKAIVSMLAELDPHSTYISKEEIERMNAPLQGNFEGIGISFNIIKDTLWVSTTISGGPSEKVGVRAGDRIIAVDGENIAGIGLKNSDVLDLLRGKKGTKVEVTVKRRNVPETLDFIIIRDKIPLFSLDASYMIDEETGYIKLSKFAATTTNEFVTALKKLQQQNLENLILDLRGNGGGYLERAKEISNHLLSDNKLIVFTEGLNEGKKEYKSTEKGIFQEGNLVVLMDEGSASASEIVAGAVQDWDRGVIIGRRSFGKGLVQKPFMLTDGSAVRLTIAHYYTPSGRCIQKPYEEGIGEYRREQYERYANGELFNEDSIHFDESQKHQTLINGRLVYGGGGIMPDIFIAADTSHHYQYISALRRKQITRNFAADYIDNNREQLKEKYPEFEQFNKTFEISEADIETIVALGEEAEVERNEESLAFVKDNLKQEIKAYIARDIYSLNELFQVLNADDETIQKALEVIEDKKEYNKLLVTTE